MRVLSFSECFWKCHLSLFKCFNDNDLLFFCFFCGKAIVVIREDTGGVMIMDSVDPQGARLIMGVITLRGAPLIVVGMITHRGAHLMVEDQGGTGPGRPCTPLLVIGKWASACPPHPSPEGGEGATWDLLSC